MFLVSDFFFKSKVLFVSVSSSCFLVFSLHCAFVIVVLNFHESNPNETT